MVRYIWSSFWRRKINEKFFCGVVTFISFTNYKLFIAPLSFLTFKTMQLFFLSKSYFCMLSSTFNIFIDILFRITIVCKCCTTFNVSLLLFNDRWICAVSLCPRVSVFFPKPCCVYILRLPLRGALPNECSRNVQKFLEKIYLWVN